jgi:hypothetical protein
MTAGQTEQALEEAETGAVLSDKVWDRIKPLRVVPRVTGTDALAWVATAPFFIVLAGAAFSRLGTWFAISPVFPIIAAYVWYLLVLLVERLLNISATHSAITLASRSETSDDMLERIRDTGTIRVEVLMTCFQALRRSSFSCGRPTKMDDWLNCKVVWTGKTQFPFITAIDRTEGDSKLSSLRVSWISFENKLEFADEKSSLAFEQHVQQFVEKNRLRGDGHELAYALTIPGVSQEMTSLWYGSLTTIPDLRANLVAFWVAAVLGLTLPYRALCRYAIPRTRVIVVKRITTRRSTQPCDEQFYPTLDLGE